MVSQRFGLKLYKNQYSHALKTLKDLVSRKKKESSGPKGSMRHDIGYYAAQIAKSYKNVDSKMLAGMMAAHLVLVSGSSQILQSSLLITLRSKDDTAKIEP